MTPKELLSPRIKVCAEYPAMDCIVGHIITIENMFATIFTVPMQAGGEKWQHAVHYEDMPHLFKKLEWWEERKPEEMPEYMKSWEHPINHNSAYSNVKIKCGVDEFWNDNNFSINKAGFVTAYGGIYIECFNPITKEEYEQQSK